MQVYPLSKSPSPIRLCGVLHGFNHLGRPCFSFVLPDVVAEFWWMLTVIFIKPSVVLNFQTIMTKVDMDSKIQNPTTIQTETLILDKFLIL